MAYLRKLSKGCEPCRSRRTKCDQKTPSCTQCVRGRRKCSGYRDLQDLIFHNESEAVIQKAQAQSKAVRVSLNVNQKRHQPAVNGATISAHFPQPLPSLFAMHTPIEDRALALFVSHYVLGKSRSFEYIDTFYSTPVMDDHLAACIRAVSLADLAEEVRSHDLLQRARKHYIYSLRCTNMALRNKVLVTKDSTLLAILLLDLFEKITARHNHRPLADLTEHIDGATKLMILRDSNQFRSEAGVRMFNHLLYIVIISCTIRHLNMPPDVLTLRSASAKLVDGSHYHWRQLDCIIRYVELRADVYTGKLSDLEEIMNLAKELDDDCAALAQSLEDMWPHTTSFTNDAASAFEGVYHIYEINFHQLKVWNSIRVGRLMVNGILQKAYLDSLMPSDLLLPDPRRAVQFQASLNATMSMALELCCAVPQYCICLPESHYLPISYESSCSTFEACSHNSSSPGVNPVRKFTYSEQASAYAMIHPLNVAVQSSAGLLTEMRLWIIDRLKFIGNIIGLPDALMVAEVIEMESTIDPWVVFAKLAGHDAPVNPFDPPTSLLGKRSKVVDGGTKMQDYLMLV